MPRSRKDPDPPLLFAGAGTDDLLVGVALDLPMDRVFTYRVPPAMRRDDLVGQRVEVPFRGRTRTGFVVECPARTRVEKVLAIRAFPDRAPVLAEDLLTLGRFVAGYYGASYGETLSAMVPRGIRRKGRGSLRVKARLAEGVEVPPPGEDGPPTAPRDRILRVLARFPDGIHLAALRRQAQTSDSPIRTLARHGMIVLETVREDALAAATLEPVPRREAPTLTPEQATCVTRVEAAIESGEFAPFLLLGVTGSGKTEVYLRAIRTCLAQDRQAIVLVPEIALTPQTVRRFRARFDRVAVLHSALTEADRAKAWRGIRAGDIDVVIGPRSAVFAPVPALGLLVVDEEQEGSFKQQNAPRYHARDVGLVRARGAGATVILGSATPALESYRNALDGRYEMLRLPNRIGGRPMPTVQIVDVRGGEERAGPGRHLGRTLEVRIGEALREKGQVILFQNRRGYATSVSCPRCGWVLECPSCDVSLTYHRSHTTALCHLCGHERKPPTACPDCALPALKMHGVGTQTVEAELAETFPDARVARMDSDTMATRDAYEDVLGRFGRGEIDVLVGTQMIGKGLHFPAVTLVGVVSADTSLVLPDFRAAERTFSLVAQVAGRAGRGDASGRVVVQTTAPDHPAVTCAADHDYETFAKGELADREAHGYPPFSRLLRVLVRGKEEAAVESRIEETAERIRGAAGDDVVLLGPAVPPIARIQELHRRHLLARCARPEALGRLLRAVRTAPRPRGVEEIWDVDPHALL